MLNRLSFYSIAFFLLTGAAVHSQPAQKTFREFSIVVVNEKSQPAEGATVSMLRANSIVRTAVTNSKGIARFGNIAPGSYSFSITYIGYKPQTLDHVVFPSVVNTATITLQPAGNVLNEVSVTSRRPAIEQQHGKGC